MTLEGALKYSEDCEKTKCRPFVKWVGGKSQLLPELLKRIPKKVNRYFEPFIGGGALFFKYSPQNACISDANLELINAYEVVRDNVEELIEELKKHIYEEKYYYEMRNIDRTSSYQAFSKVKRASRLIYLNKTCFNGLYRVNSKGYFNTPFGKYTNPTIADGDNLRACSSALKGATILHAGFESIEVSITKEDFVYFDPPYVPLNATSLFTQYNSEGFDLETQKKLFELCDRLDKKGIRFMLSNSFSPIVLELYQKFKIEEVLSPRFINSNAKKRGSIKEAIITNY